MVRQHSHKFTIADDDAVRAPVDTQLSLGPQLYSEADTLCIRHVNGLNHARMQLVWALIYTREIHLP